MEKKFSKHLLKAHRNQLQEHHKHSKGRVAGVLKDQRQCPEGRGAEKRPSDQVWRKVGRMESFIELSLERKRKMAFSKHLGRRHIRALNGGKWIEWSWLKQTALGKAYTAKKGYHRSHRSWRNTEGPPRQLPRDSWQSLKVHTHLYTRQSRKQTQQRKLSQVSTHSRYSLTVTFSSYTALDLKKKKFRSNYIYVLQVCMHVHCMYSWCLRRSEKRSRSLGNGVTEGCEWPCGCWESHLDSLQE